MDKGLTAVDVADNGGRRRVRDRRFLVSAPCARERRTHWDRRCGYDRRLRRIMGYPDNRRSGEDRLAGQP
ncbi:hypothetical protein [Desulfosarcina sp.]|uniref:hypothetical protein n=1 Tax=Desulfosarcina sp. TaxID=2027861 RepID=UPI0039706EDA